MLFDLGVVEAYIRVKAAYPERVSLNLLYALQGALMDLPWNEIQPEIKHKLEEQTNQMQEKTILRKISAEETRPMRNAILRPGYPPELSIYPNDDDNRTFHTGAYHNEVLVGVASLFHESPPYDESIDGWRLRGMAVVENKQRQGIGRALVESCLVYAKSQHGEIMWCNARTSASHFYHSLGFIEHGNEFNIPESGPHYIMWRSI
jgi:GNAT superfamily N-acetyltransferase